MTDVETGTADAVADRADELRAAMVAGVVERGLLTPEWRPALEQVARHAFLPDTVWEHDSGLAERDYVPLRRAESPERWLTAAYAPAPVFTQVDDGAVDDEGRGENVSSSASCPNVVAVMLDALKVEPGMRVLEIGTGTGWNAALLAHRLGAENVVSVEIDAALADAARARLDRAGFGAVTVLTAEDVDPATAHGPYDRLLATVAARQIPPAWIAQVRPGGIAVIPWGTSWYPSALLRLDVADGARASGRIIDDAVFMQLRDQRQGRASLLTEVWERSVITSSMTELHPWDVAGDEHAATAIGFRLPGIAQYFHTDHSDPPGGELVVVERGGDSWALVKHRKRAPCPVEQAGPRRLWDEVEAAHRWWQDLGEPERGRWVITVGPEGQRIELGPPGTDADTEAGPT